MKLSVKGGQVTACPQCGNLTEFVARSQQIAEDLCETWIECMCGFDPTRGGPERFESPMGGCSPEYVRAALQIWNELLWKMPVACEDRNEQA
jgi:hypothetical protein